MLLDCVGWPEGCHNRMQLVLFSLIVLRRSPSISFRLPKTRRLTVTPRNDGDVDLRRSSVNVPSCSHEGNVIDAVDLEDVPLAVLADQERVRKVERKKKAGGLCKMSREGKPNPIPEKQC